MTRERPVWPIEVASADPAIKLFSTGAVPPDTVYLWFENNRDHFEDPTAATALFGYGPIDDRALERMTQGDLDNMSTPGADRDTHGNPAFIEERDLHADPRLEDGGIAAARDLARFMFEQAGFAPVDE